MATPQQLERHVGGGVERLRIMPETGHIEGKSGREIDMVILTRGGRIKRRFHIEIMAERHVVLGPGLQTEEQTHRCHYQTFYNPHDKITVIYLKYYILNQKTVVLRQRS